MSAAATNTIAAACRCLLVQRNVGPAYSPRGGSSAMSLAAYDRRVARYTQEPE
jgi:hypothetical protein